VRPIASHGICIVASGHSGSCQEAILIDGNGAHWPVRRRSRLGALRLPIADLP